MSAPVDAHRDVELAAATRSVVMRLARELRQQFRTPFTATQASVLGAIHLAGPVSLGELASRERLSPPMITKVVASLEEHGVVERLVDERDRRVCLVQVSDAGQRWIDEVVAEADAGLAERLDALSPQERSLLATAVPLLERLIEDGT